MTHLRHLRGLGAGRVFARTGRCRLEPKSRRFREAERASDRNRPDKECRALALADRVSGQRGAEGRAASGSPPT